MDMEESDNGDDVHDETGHTPQHRARTQRISKYNIIVTLRIIAWHRRRGKLAKEKSAETADSGQTTPTASQRTRKDPGVKKYAGGSREGPGPRAVPPASISGSRRLLLLDHHSPPIRGAPGDISTLRMNTGG